MSNYQISSKYYVTKPLKLQDTIHFTDPCYIKDNAFGTKLSNLASGTWFSSIEMLPQTQQITAIKLTNIDYLKSNLYNESTINYKSFDITDLIDSGCYGIISSEKYASIVENNQFDTWYEKNIIKSLCKNEFVQNDDFIFVRTPYGDNTTPTAYIAEHNNKITHIMIDFSVYADTASRITVLPRES